MLALVPLGCTQPPSLDPAYAPDHQNYLCMNYTRATPLPCQDTSQGWRPRWFDKQGRPRFIVYAWWPPATPDFAAYADAGFNLALTGNALGGYCAHKGLNSTVTHDELFDANVAASVALAKHGILTVFNTDNDCNEQLDRSPTVAYGNATGGLVEGFVNLTAKAPGPFHWTGQVARSKGQTVPELEYITAELTRRSVAEHFAAIQIHDDTLTQTGATIAAAAWLKAHAPWLVPLVNQVGGNSGPQTLHRSGLFVAAPEQYPLACPVCRPGAQTRTSHQSATLTRPGSTLGQDSNCTTINATQGALAQMNLNAGNAAVDARFGLHHWPLFQIGGGNGPLDGPSSPDAGRQNVRSDSLVRWMAYSAIAYGAKGLNYYCWCVPAHAPPPDRPPPHAICARSRTPQLQGRRGLLVQSGQDPARPALAHVPDRA